MKFKLSVISTDEVAQDSLVRRSLFSHTKLQLQKPKRFIRLCWRDEIENNEWVRNVACIQKMRNSYRSSVRKHDESDHFVIDSRIIFKWILNKYYVRIGTRNVVPKRPMLAFVTNIRVLYKVGSLWLASDRQLLREVPGLCEHEEIPAVYSVDNGNNVNNDDNVKEVKLHAVEPIDRSRQPYHTINPTSHLETEKERVL